MEGYYERVVEVLTGAGYRWYETANFSLAADDRDLRARHNLGYWLGRDYLGVGVGAVSTIGDRRWRNAPSVTRYVAALARGARPQREPEPLDGPTRRVERLMLGLRLDEPLPLVEVADVLDGDELARLERLDLVRRDDATIALTPRGRRLGGAVTARLLA
jgi:oxygen-independent coproporphyrinogen-3 oxidase